MHRYTQTYACALTHAYTHNHVHAHTDMHVHTHTEKMPLPSQSIMYSHHAPGPEEQQGACMDWILKCKNKRRPREAS